MSLNDLGSFIDKQKEAITTASSMFIPCTKPSWVAFRNDLWGDDKESFQDEKPVESIRVDPVADIQLPSHHLVAAVPPPVRNLFTVESNKLLVRSEYVEAEQAAVRSCKTRTRVFVIGGSLGIGKTAFILWLLMRRLALRLPTVLHFQKSQALLFDDRGVWELLALDDGVSYQPLYVEPGEWSQRIWALVDLGLEEPGWIFQRPPFFVVNTVSSRSDHLKWLGKLPTQHFYMNPWSDSEVLQVRPLLASRFTEYQIWHLHKEFGASLRNISHFADNPSEYEYRLRKKALEVNADRLPHIFREPGSYPLSHFIVTIQSDPENRSRGLTEVASHRVFEMLWERHIKNRLDLMSTFYDLFRYNAIGAASAGLVFKFRMHQVLTKRQTIQLLRMRGRVTKVNYIYETPPTPDRTTLHLPASTEANLVEVEGTETQLQPNEYYRPHTTTFPAIDSLLLIPPPSGGSPHVLLMLQVTHNRSEHDVNPKGLERVNRLNLPHNTQKYFVVVTPENVHPEIKVPLKYFEDTGTGGLTRDEAFPVFQSPFGTGELFVE